MIVLYFVLYLLAGVCFGAAAGNATTRRLNPINFLGLGLVFFVLVEVIRLGANL